MKRASLTETKNRLSALIDEVREGESILVLHRGRPVARIEPVVGDDSAPPGRLERLERRGLIRRAEKRADRDGTGLPKSGPVELKGDVSVLDVLLEERRSGR